MMQEKKTISMSFRLEKRKYQVFKTALSINEISLQGFIENCIDNFLDERPEFKKIAVDETFGKK